MRRPEVTRRLIFPAIVLICGACPAGTAAPLVAAEAEDATAALPPEDITPPMSKWEARVHAALRRESSTKGAQQQQAVRDLVSLYEALEKAKGIDKDERADLRRLVRNRLVRSSERISKRLDKSGKKPAAESVAASASPTGDTAPVATAPVAPPVASGSGQGGQQMPPDYGLELVELIQHTIAPQSWDVNGGNGTIIYFAPRQAIVVRQTDDVHGDLGNLLRELHK